MSDTTQEIVITAPQATIELAAAGLIDTSLPEDQQPTPLKALSDYLTGLVKERAVAGARLEIEKENEARLAAVEGGVSNE